MKVSKNLLKMICIIACAVLVAVQIVYIVQLGAYENKIAGMINLAEYSLTASPEPEITEQPAEEVIAEAEVTEPPVIETPVPVSNERIIVLDAGHGKSSGSMSADEKAASGWVQNASGNWGEWRHWKSGTMWVDYQGEGCNHRNDCWYPIGNGDRSIEPEVNLNNTLAAKKYLEEMNYTVRLARSSNEENPSLTRRLTNCYPNGDTSAAPDAIAYVCIHSNASGGGARGTAYLALSSGYDHAYSDPNYAEDGNRLGALINQRIASETSLSAFGGNGCYTGQPDLILFHKSPVPIGYMEIGFFDNSSDLSILRSESDAIGKAIAEGIDDYVKEKGL